MSATLSDESNEVTYLIRFISLISSENSDRETKIICICTRSIRSYPIRFHATVTTETGFCRLPCSPKRISTKRGPSPCVRLSEKVPTAKVETHDIFLGLRYSTER
jgi:hypothetical protein